MGEWGGSLGTSGELVSSLVAYLPFDGNANDISGNGLNGTVNGATLIADREGNTNGAYSFDGTNDYIELTNTQNSMSFIQNTGVFSIVTWLKLEDLNARSTVISSTTTSLDKGFTFLYDTYGGQFGDHQLRFTMSNGTSGTYSTALGAQNSINDTNWHHVAVVGDGEKVRFYVDGQQDGAETTLNVFSTGASTHDALIGAARGNSGSLLNWLSGSVDNLQVYDRRLNGQEINQLASGQTPEEIDATNSPRLATASRGLAHYDYGFRIYNPALGRFLSVDPLTSSYPMLTPYQFASNTPIGAIDMDGLESRDFRYAAIGQQMGATTITSQNYDELFQKQVRHSIATETPRARNLRYTIGGVLTGLSAAALGGYGVQLIRNNWFNLLFNPVVHNEIAAGLYGTFADDEWAIPAVSDNATKGLRKLAGVADVSRLGDDGFRVGGKVIKEAVRSIDNVSVTDDGIKLIQKHLSRSELDPDAANDVMIERLKSIANGELDATDTDLYFYTHELSEYNLMEQGYLYEEAHAISTKAYGIKAKDEVSTLYTPEAIQKGEESFLNGN